MEFTLYTLLIIVSLFPWLVFGNITFVPQDKEIQRAELIADIITFNVKPNGWNNIYCVGHLPDRFYNKIKHLNFTTTVSNAEDDEHQIEEDRMVPYHSNAIVIVFKDFIELEDAFVKAMGSPYWHPHSNIILYYHSMSREDIPKIFIILWFFRACNAIIVQYDDLKDSLIVTHYSPYVTENSTVLENKYGCWKATKIGFTLTGFRDSFVCEKGCHNVTLNSVLRARNLGTCIGFTSHPIHYSDREYLQKLQLFEDKSKNLHGFELRAHTIAVEPFLIITENGDGTYNLSSRDGMIWNTYSNLMNFKIDLTASKDIIKQPFNFEVNIQLIYTFAKRQADLVLLPIYLFDVIVVEIDFGIAYKDSGVCLMSHRAAYETMLFDVKLMQENSELVIRFVFCFLLIWIVFLIYNVAEKGQFSFDQVGKDLMNTIRNILSISLYKPPRRSSFRIFMGVSIWSFFVINFATQAAIISFFSSYKRGKEVETFDDAIEKDYVVEGMASPDMMLPETDDAEGERFRKINSKLVPLKDLFGCVNHMTNDSRRFCLIDCSVGRYLERNRLNEKGEQYLHIAKDRIHSHYLSMIFHKHSPLTARFNHYMRRFFEAGLIKKWEQYRYPDIKQDVLTKPLDMGDLIGIFKCFYLFLGFSSVVFMLEVAIGIMLRARRYFSIKLAKWRKIRATKNT